MLAAHRAAAEAIAAQQRELDRRLAQSMAQLAPLMEQTKQLTEVVATLNLYFGRDEEVYQIATGERASADEPLHIRQSVLAMDEETAIAAATGGIDARHIDQFDKWLTSNPAHLAQVLPEKRGIVALIARRHERAYGDPWTDSALNKLNQETWWLIRNGENLYRMRTGFNVGAHLVPKRDEFIAMFRTAGGASLEPGTREWLVAEKQAGARQRHFMKIALILQGLVDRTKLLHPLPEGGLNLLAAADYDNGRVIQITDAELTLGTGRKPFRQWLADLNKHLRPGMRVMIATNHVDWPSPDLTGRHPRLTPATAAGPGTGRAYVIKRRGTHVDEWVVTYPRTEQVFIRGRDGREEYRTPRTAASCTIYTTDMFVLPIDLVDVATLRDYLNARGERHAYAQMFPTLTAAVELLEAEAEAEEPFRVLLTEQVAAAEGLDLPTARKAVNDAVSWWKIGNKHHRPLQGDGPDEARAAAAILAERARITKAQAASNPVTDAHVIATQLAAHPDTLIVARRKSGDYVALSPASRRGDSTVVADDVWVDEQHYTAAGKPSTMVGPLLPLSEEARAEAARVLAALRPAH